MANQKNKVAKKPKFSFDKQKFYSIEESIKLVKESSRTKFISSIDIAVKLNLDTSKAEQQLRGTLALPHFFGKKKKILVLDVGLTDKDASKLGVDFAGDKEKIDEISKGWLDFDLIITTPKMMPQLSKLGKILGTRGLMPNPKIGNVTTNLEKTISEFKKGVSQYRTDSYGNIHMTVGKVDADDKKIIENINFLLDFLSSKKPATVKGVYIQNVSLSSTMGPGVKIAINKANDKKVKSNNKKVNLSSSKKENAKPIYYKPIYVYEKKKIENKNPINPPKVDYSNSIKKVVKPTSKLVVKSTSNKLAVNKPIAKTNDSVKENATKVNSKPIAKSNAKLIGNKPAVTKPIAKTNNSIKKNDTKNISKPIAKSNVKSTTSKPVAKIVSKKPSSKQVVKPTIKKVDSKKSK